MTVQNILPVPTFYYYDDFEDNLLTGRTWPRNDWNNGSAGTTAISSTSPLNGTYSLTHVGNGTLSHYNRAYMAQPWTPFTTDFRLEFRLKVVTAGTNAACPYGMLFIEYYDANNFTAIEFYYDGSTYTVMRIKQRVASVNTYYGTMNFLTGKIPVGNVYNFAVRRTSTTVRVVVNNGLKIAVAVPALTSANNQLGMSGQYDTKIMVDKILFRVDVSNATYDGTLATYGAFSAELDYTTHKDPDAPADTDSTIRFGDIDFPMELVITKPDGNVSRTAPFTPRSTQTYQLGYDGIDKYLAMRLRIIGSVTQEAIFNIKQITFTSE